MNTRMVPGELTLADVYALSKKYYKGKVDDKKRRMRLDVVSAKIIRRNNLRLDRSTGKWEQSGQVSKIICMVSSKPKSYVRTDTIKIHRYPVTFVFDDLSKGAYSSFRWRTGSLKNPILNTKGKSKTDRVKIANQNIKNQVQLQFFFEIEFVSKISKTLFGRCRAKYAPRKTNPKMLLFFDKTALAVVEGILLPLLGSRQGIAIGQEWKNKSVK